MPFDLSSILQKYAGGTPPPPADVGAHYDQVAQGAPPNVMRQGLADAFRSDSTPPFSQMMGQLFGNANGSQRSGMLGNLLSSLAPAALGTIGAKLGNAFGGGVDPRNISPQQADQVTPDQVKDIAQQAEAHDPSIIDKMGDFYTQHPGLVKTLEGAILTVALAKMSQGMR
jgi:hypothetical protein